MSHVLQRLQEAAKVRWEALNSAWPEPVTSEAEAERDVVRLVPIASGKGGVGKTNLAVGISISAGLAFASSSDHSGKRVLLIDGDLGLPNTDLVLGVRPDHSISNLIVDKSIDDMSQLISQTRYPALDFIAGAEEATLVLGNLYYQQRRSIMGKIARLKSALVIFDLGASASKEILDFFAMSSSGIVVLNPEPPSIRDGYVFLKNALIRRVRQEFEFEPRCRLEFDSLVEVCGGSWQKLRIAVPETGSHELREIWNRTMESYKPMIILNRVESFHEGIDSARKFIAACGQHLGIKVRYLGSVVSDDAVRRAVKAQRPFRVLEPDCPASKCVDEIARRILNDEEFDLSRNFSTFGRIVTSRLLGRPT